jgi:hypothetical protein
MEVSASSAGNATKLLHLHKCKTIMVHKLCYVVKQDNFVNWCLHGVYAGHIGQTFLLFSCHLTSAKWIRTLQNEEKVLVCRKSDVNSLMATT